MSSIALVEPKITILDQNVNMVDGLYSLNDVHRIGSGEKRHQPSLFVRNKEVTELADEIMHSTNLQSDQVLRRINGGENRGTYACKEMVYRYAMWISPKFALIVIRTFDDLMNKRLENNGYQLGDLQKLSDEVDAEYAVGFSIASNGGKIMNDWKGKKAHLEARKAAIQELMQPLLTGFNEAKAVEVVK